ncbi:GNAT family N-acetyltransferase [Pseudopedobacter saltans]|uniref:GNAT family N-acetyltransferase n=1 Tax=Pseudopedobacter saltans TaxID=151895 RepID=UPI0001EBC471|nr:GNAT family N-acetyltransferase [Pseudopedobacter saltans]
MEIDIQPILTNDSLVVLPLAKADFKALYKVASDPKIWEQHPNKDRWKEHVFKIFFDGAIESKGAFKIIDKSSRKILGSTRFYNYDDKQNSIFMGYTFYATSCWEKE